MSAVPAAAPGGAVGRVLWRSRKWEVPVGAIGAGIAESDFGTFPGIREALHTAVEHELLTYLPDAEAEALRLAFTGFAARRYRWSVDPEAITITPDVLTALTIALEHLVEPGPVVLPIPAYSPFTDTVRNAGRQLVTIPMAVHDGAWRLDLDRVAEAFAGGARLLLLCNPHNPLGAVADRDELTVLAELAARHGARIFADEIHAPIVYSGHRHVPLASVSDLAADVAITATSASKGWNVSGLKSAQLVLTNPADRRTVADQRLLPQKFGSVLGVIAGQQAYSPAGEAWLDTTVARLQANRDLLVAGLAEQLPQAELLSPAGTYLAWIGLAGERLGDRSAAEHLAEHARIDVGDGTDSGDAYRHRFRLNFAMPPDRLAEAVQRIADAVR